MTTNWKEQLFELMDTPLARNEGRRDRMYHFITTLLEKQREDIINKIKRCPIEETDSVKQDYTQTIYLNGEEVKQKIIDTISK